jgi:isopentenyl-diphosphate Delta-isomerase
MEQVILVDENDNMIGSMDKLDAHHKGVLHRAFSILLFNSKGELLIQKRAAAKYHSGGLWTNTCCSHPVPGEPIDIATRRRLQFEMGIDSQTRFAYKFIYNVPLDKNLTEHELDHVFIGTFDGVPQPNPEEVEDWKYVNIPDLMKDMALNPERYTHWFKLILRHPELNQFVKAYSIAVF